MCVFFTLVHYQKQKKTKWKRSLKQKSQKKISISLEANINGLDKALATSTITTGKVSTLTLRGNQTKRGSQHLDRTNLDLTEKFQFNLVSFIYLICIIHLIWSNLAYSNLI